MFQLLSTSARFARGLEPFRLGKSQNATAGRLYGSKGRPLEPIDGRTSGYCHLCGKSSRSPTAGALSPIGRGCAILCPRRLGAARLLFFPPRISQRRTGAPNARPAGSRHKHPALQLFHPRKRTAYYVDGLRDRSDRNESVEGGIGHAEAIGGVGRGDERQDDGVERRHRFDRCRTVGDGRDPGKLRAHSPSVQRRAGTIVAFRRGGIRDERLGLIPRRTATTTDFFGSLIRSPTRISRQRTCSPELGWRRFESAINAFG